MDENYYYRIDERENTFGSLEKVKIFLENTISDDSYWKWAMIALHSALYGSMILALLGSNPERVKDKKRSKTKKYGDVEVEEPFLIGFHEAFRRVQGPEYMEMYVNSRFLCIVHKHEDFNKRGDVQKKAKCFAPEVGESVEHLHEYIRNQFMHYYPMSISYSKNDFLEIIRHSLQIIGFLLVESGNVRLEEEDEKRIEGALLGIGKICS